MKKVKSKKSENLEVRISYETKLALHRKAKEDGRSVSSVVRSLIEGYLVAPAERPKQRNSSQILSRLKALIGAPKIILTSLIAAAGMSLVFMPAATADEIAMDISGEIVRPVDGGTRTKRMKTSLIITEGVTYYLPMGQPNYDLKKHMTPKKFRMDRSLASAWKI
ncbi:MAG: hypothetical protein ACPGVT_00815 [Maricaulaceae bacterium]